LVSNAFEGTRGVALLGMQRFQKEPALAGLFTRDNLIIAGQAPAGAENDPKNMPNISRSNSHGGFDNDPDTLNSVLYRILDGPPPRPFTTRDLQF
jgi:hypothetical protein